MARRRVVITLPTDAYRRLVELAEAEERVVDQQASLLLKRLLIDAESESERSNSGDGNGRLANACATDVSSSVECLQSDPCQWGSEVLPS